MKSVMDPASAPEASYRVDIAGEGYPRLIQMKVNDLVGSDYNPRKITPEALARLQKSMDELGNLQPITWNVRTRKIVGGHQRLKWYHAKKIKVADVWAVDLSEVQERAANLALNKLAGDFDLDALRAMVDGLKFEGVDVEQTGFSVEELDDLIGKIPEEITEDEVPEVPVDAITKPGDLWILGEHRLLCGDSTKAEDVGRLMGGHRAQLIHADPPYGMGKEKDGVQNDNLYADKLDAFQMAWWRVFRKHTDDNGSAYIWGNSEELWRLWYVGGLKDSERLTLRNQIVWDKKHGQGMSSEDHRMFPTATEHCLFFMLGEQGFNNNADNYWEGWDSVVNYLRAEKEKTGWDIATFKRLAGHSETSGCHWFDKSQWSFPTKEVYQTWQVAAKGKAFKREHDELKREFYATRAYFDNTHDSMTDVWEFKRVTGEERHGHATPKPVAMMVRAIKSSCPDGGIVAEPFLGSGTTLIAAEQLGRKCYGMEISPNYCDVIVKRWENLTKKQAAKAVP